VILEQYLFCNEKIKSYIKKFYDDFTSQDVMSDLCLAVIHKGVDNFKSKDEVERYCFTIVKNSVKNKSTKKKYCKQGLDLSFEVSEESGQDILNYSLDHLTWYEKEIMMMYIDKVPVDNISRMTRIPRSSIYNTIKNSIKKIKKNASCTSL
jgi:RNA polymerase sigma factor (sigma-70 family)